MPKAKSLEGTAGDRTEHTISVTASASVSAIPDTACVSARIITDAETAADALSRNNESMRSVVAGLGNLGVTGRDIRTAAFQIEPRYAPKPPPGAPPQIVGYRVVNQLALTVRHIEALGTALDQLVRLGINQMDSLSFEVSNVAELMDEARSQAMAVALARAKRLAADAGAQVGDVMTIVEGAAPAHGIPLARAAMMESVPIERGLSTISAQVSVTWALK